MGKFSLSSMLDFFKKDHRVNERILPPVNLNKPVENPISKAIMIEFIKAGNREMKPGFMEILNKTNYLIPVIVQPKPEPSPDAFKCEFGTQTEFKKGTLIGLLNAYDKDKNCCLPAFTDWEEIQRFTNGKVKVDVWVMPGNELWPFVARNNSYKGIVINPAGYFMMLDAGNIDLLIKTFKK
jgi:hypothetical protein